MNIDDVLDARAARRDLWARACSGQISTAALYAALAQLRAAVGDELYARPAREPRR